MGEWKIGLFGCFGNCSSSIITYVIPCIPFATNAEKTDTCGFCCSAGLFFVPFVGQYIGAKSRQAAREQHDIGGTCCCDCLLFSACPCCVIVQTQTQLGIDMGEEIARN